MNPKSAGKFVAANSILAIGQHPKCGHPFVQPKRRILKDRVDLERELLFAWIAEPQLAGLDKRVLLGAATWARNFAIGPAQLDRICESAVLIGEVNDRFLEGFRSAFMSKHYTKRTCVSTRLLPNPTPLFSRFCGKTEIFFEEYSAPKSVHRNRGLRQLAQSAWPSLSPTQQESGTFQAVVVLFPASICWPMGKPISLLC